MNEKMAKRLKAAFPDLGSQEKRLDAKASADTLDLAIYGEIEPDRVNYWTDEVIPSETSARHFKEVLDSHPNVTTINLAINSTGGYLSEGNAIYTMLKRHNAKVNVTIDAFACSMASGIAMAGDHVSMAPQALLMIHNPSGMVYGNATELRKAADDLDVMGDAFRQMYLLKANGKLEESKLIEMLDAETYLTAAQALEFGLCDEIEFVDESEAYKSKITALEAKIASLEAKLSSEPEPIPDPTPEPTEPARKGWFFKS